MITTRKMGEKQMVAFRTHLVSFLGELLLGQRHIPCGFRHLAALIAPQSDSLSLQCARRDITFARNDSDVLLV